MEDRQEDQLSSSNIDLNNFYRSDHRGYLKNNSYDTLRSITNDAAIFSRVWYHLSPGITKELIATLRKATHWIANE